MNALTDFRSAPFEEGYCGPFTEDDGRHWKYRLPPIEHDRVIDMKLHAKFFGEGEYSSIIPEYTSDIGDAVALCKTVLPGWIWRLCECSVSDDAWLAPDMNHPRFGVEFRECWPDMRDPLEDGPGLDMSFAPPGRPAAALCAVLLSVVEGLKLGQQPRATTEAMWQLIGNPHMEGCKLEGEEAE